MFVTDTNTNTNSNANANTFLHIIIKLLKIDIN